MAKYEGLKRDNGVIINDRWRLVPCEGRNANNWELYEFRDDKWRSVGRFYQYNTIHLALQYVIDRELYDERFESAEELAEHLREYERIVTTMTDALKTALEARQTS